MFYRMKYLFLAVLSLFVARHAQAATSTIYFTAELTSYDSVVFGPSGLNMSAPGVITGSFSFDPATSTITGTPYNSGTPSELYFYQYVASDFTANVAGVSLQNSINRMWTDNGTGSSSSDRFVVQTQYTLLDPLILSTGAVFAYMELVLYGNNSLLSDNSIPTIEQLNKNWLSESLKFRLAEQSTNSGGGTDYNSLGQASYSNLKFFDAPQAITAIPLPAALPLMAGVIGILGIFGWRRKSLGTA